MSVACSSGGGGEDGPVVISPDGGNEARVPISISTTLSRVSGDAFEPGDALGLYVVNRRSDGTSQTLQTAGNHVNNMRYTYDSSWKPDAPVYWKDETTHADFYLYCPYRPTVSNTEGMTFSVSTNQRTEAAYKGSDLLAGSTLDAAPSAAPVLIEARHVMSRAQIKIVAGNGFSSEELAAAKLSVHINGVQTQSVVNLSTGSVSPAGNVTEVVPFRQADGTYEAFLVPQSLAEDNLITVNVDGTDYQLRRTANFESGKSYTFTLTLDKTSAGVNVSITGWDDDGVDYGGTATE